MAGNADRRQKPHHEAPTSPQSQRFVEAAREFDADQSEEAFDKALRRIARTPVPEKKPKKPR